MALYAISDLHLSNSTDKPMDVFGDNWKDHDKKITENWNSLITDDDTVLIAGDLSWALKFEDALADLDFIHNLNGRKIIVKGNHDLWWTSISKINALYDDMNFIQNTHYEYEGYAICGTRGWINLEAGEECDAKVYKREVLRLKMSLDSAKKCNHDKIIVMMHYPPATKISKSQEFVDLLKEYKVETLIYGHIHNMGREICINGEYDGIDFRCSSADLIGFCPIRIL